MDMKNGCSVKSLYLLVGYMYQYEDCKVRLVEWVVWWMWRMHEGKFSASECLVRTRPVDDMECSSTFCRLDLPQNMSAF